MEVYLSSPGNQMHADYLRGMPVLLSYGSAKPWMRDYAPSFRRLLVDSGAFSVLNSGATVDLGRYAAWAQEYHWADAVAALDDIAGDWQQGLRNWERHPWMFPTFHSSDPDEVLGVLLERVPKWLGLGMVPPRDKREWLERTLDRIPPGVHVHGWALGSYAELPRLDSVDSTNWWRDAFQYRKDLPWLTPAECVELVVKRYQRANRMRRAPSTQGALAL